MGNPNHPRRGSIIWVAPIRSQEKIKEIEMQLRYEPRNLAFFDIGINSNLRGNDLRRLTVGDVAGLKVGDVLLIREKKTGKVRRIPLNRKVIKVLAGWLAVHPQRDDPEAPLFLSARGGQALSVGSMTRLVKKWCAQAGLTENYGAHTMRKTFGYIQRSVHSTDIATLMVMYNHSTEKQTLAYLGVDDTEIRAAFMKEI
jgi:integrase